LSVHADNSFRNRWCAVRAHNTYYFLYSRHG